MQNTNTGLICHDSDDVTSMKDPQFFADSKYLRITVHLRSANCSI